MTGFKVFVRASVGVHKSNFERLFNQSHSQKKLCLSSVCESSCTKDYFKHVKEVGDLTDEITQKESH